MTIRLQIKSFVTYIWLKMAVSHRQSSGFPLNPDVGLLGESPVFVRPIWSWGCFGLDSLNTVFNGSLRDFNYFTGYEINSKYPSGGFESSHVSQRDRTTSPRRSHVTAGFVHSLGFWLLDAITPEHRQGRPHPSHAKHVLLYRKDTGSTSGQRGFHSDRCEINVNFNVKIWTLRCNLMR